MAEITYQMVLSTLQTAGLLVGISYYILTLRNQQKNQKHAQETRKIQLLNEMNETIVKQQWMTWFDIMDMNWENYQDFMSKYGYGNDPELYQQRIEFWRNLNRNGLLIRDGLIDIRSYCQYVDYSAPLVWRKFKDIIMAQREAWGNLELYIGIEILADETDLYRSSLGQGPQKYVEARAHRGWYTEILE